MGELSIGTKNNVTLLYSLLFLVQIIDDRRFGKKRPKKKKILPVRRTQTNSGQGVESVST